MLLKDYYNHNNHKLQLYKLYNMVIKQRPVINIRSKINEFGEVFLQYYYT